MPGVDHEPWVQAGYKLQEALERAGAVFVEYHDEPPKKRSVFLLHLEGRRLRTTVEDLDSGKKEKR